MFSVEETLTTLEAGRLITRMEDKVKRSLVGACDRLRRDFLEKTAGAPVDTGIVFFYNLGSLLQYHYGEFDRAELLCGHIIDVCHGLAAHENPQQWLASMIQPYINSARVAAARGDADRSLGILKQVKLFVEGKEDLQIAGYRLSKEGVHDLDVGEENMVLVGRNVYLTDSVRAFLFVKDYDGLLQFLAAIESDPFYFENTANRGTFLEAKARAFLGLQQYGEALNVLRDFTLYMKENSSRIYPAIYTLSAEVYWRCGQPAEAAKVLQFAEKLIDRALHARRSIVIGNHVYLVGLSYFVMGDFDGAARCTSKALEIAREASDEVLTMKALMLLLQTEGKTAAGSQENIAAWQTMLGAQADATFYRFERALSYISIAALKDPAAGNRSKDLLAGAQRLLRSINTAYAKAYEREISSQNGNAKHPTELGTGNTIGHEWTNDVIDQAYRLLLDYVPDRWVVRPACEGLAAIAAAS